MFVYFMSLIIFEAFFTTNYGTLITLIIIFMATFILISVLIKWFVPRAVFQEKENEMNTQSYYNFPLDLFIHSLSSYFEKYSTEGKLREEETHNFCGPCIDVRNESQTFAKLICEHFIHFWYKTISHKNQQFVNDCETVMQQMFVTFFEKCEKLNRNQVLNKTLILFQKHANNYFNTRENEMQSDAQFMDDEYKCVEELVQRTLRICAPKEVQCIINETRSARMQPEWSLFIMIREMLTESVVIPISTIITDPKWIYTNITCLCNDYINKMNEMPNKHNEYQEPLPLTDMTLNLTEANVQIDSNPQINRQDLVVSQSVHDFFRYDQSASDCIESFSTSHHLPDDSNRDEADCLISNTSLHSSTKMLSSECVEAIEAEEIDIKLFTNIRISDTKEINGYILYCILYDALYEEINQSPCEANITPYLARKTVSVYRRFSEFIALEERLKEHHHLKKLIKTIKKPSSIKLTAQNILAFTGSQSAKLDSSTIEFRKQFLQKFLNDLCSNDLISESVEMQQFLAYGSDARIAFVKSKSHALLPTKIDRVLFSGVKGAISIIKTALPVEPQVGRVDPTSTDRINNLMCDMDRITIKPIPSSVDEFNVMHLEKKLDERLEFYELNDMHVERNDGCAEDHINEYLGPRYQGDGCEAEDVHMDNSPSPETFPDLKENEYQSINLSSQVIKTFIMLLNPNGILTWKLIFTKLIKVLLGEFIEKKITEMVPEIMRRDKFVEYLHKLHLTLWPSNLLDTTTNETNAELDDQDVETRREESQKLLRSLIASQLNLVNLAFCNLVMQQSSINHLISNFLNCLMSPKNNKIFLYTFMSMILDDIENNHQMP